MARTIPFARTAQAARARRSKTLLLPMPRPEVDRVCLPVHIVLDAMRRGRGNVTAAQTLYQAMILTGVLAEAGHGTTTFEQMREAETIISAAFDRGRDSDVWALDDEGFRQFAVIVTTYDYQLRRAPLAVVADASDQLDSFRAGESLDRMQA